jgi:hypothetical protein
MGYMIAFTRKTENRSVHSKSREADFQKRGLRRGDRLRAPSDPAKDASAGEGDTVLTGVSAGDGVRGVRNRLTDEMRRQPEKIHEDL